MEKYNFKEEIAKNNENIDLLTAFIDVKSEFPIELGKFKLFCLERGMPTEKINSVAEGLVKYRVIKVLDLSCTAEKSNSSIEIMSDTPFFILMTKSDSNKFKNLTYKYYLVDRNSKVLVNMQEITQMTPKQNNIIDNKYIVKYEVWIIKMKAEENYTLKVKISNDKEYEILLM